MQEIWKDIEGYDGYQVSNFGQVRSLDRKVICSNGLIQKYRGRILRPSDSKGYSVVMLPDRKWHKVHRLVADAFLPNPNNFPQVNHKDENKQNNNVSNLEWCTASYNNTYGTRVEQTLATRKRLNYKNAEKAVLMLPDNIEFRSIQEAARQTGIPDGNICMCCTGKVKSAGGYQWRYK